MGASIAALSIETAIYVALEVVRAVKPRASASERTARKPFWAVVAVGRTRIRSVVIITIRAVGGGSNANANADLSLYFGSGDVKQIPATATNARYLNPFIKSPFFTRIITMHICCGRNEHQTSEPVRKRTLEACVSFGAPVHLSSDVDSRLMKNRFS